MLFLLFPAPPRGDGIDVPESGEPRQFESGAGVSTLVQWCAPTPEIHSLTISFTPTGQGISSLSLEALRLLNFIALASFLRQSRSTTQYKSESW